MSVLAAMNGCVARRCRSSCRVRSALSLTMLVTVVRPGRTSWASIFPCFAPTLMSAWAAFPKPDPKRKCLCYTSTMFSLNKILFTFYFSYPHIHSLKLSYLLRMPLMAAFTIHFPTSQRAASHCFSLTFNEAEGTHIFHAHVAEGLGDRPLLCAPCTFRKRFL